MKKTFNFYVLILITLFGFGHSACAQKTAPVKEKNSNDPRLLQTEFKEFLNRLNKPRLANLFAAASWTLIHDYSSSERAEEVLKTVQIYLEAFEKNKNGNSADLERLGGVKAFKDKLAAWLSDDDQSIRAFAAVTLGISGDKTYASQLASLLESERKYKERDLLRYDKARAATALGLLGAKEYTQKLAEMLNSKNEFDRAGAAYGLGFLKAKEHVAAVSRLLKDKNENVREAAAEALKLMEESDATKD